MTALAGDLDELLTAAQVAKIVRLHKVTVYGKVRSGEIACVRQGRKVLVPRWAVQAYLDGCTQHTTRSDADLELLPTSAPARPTPPARTRRNPHRNYVS
jgi:excisionase family DNA binding protein